VGSELLGLHESSNDVPGRHSLEQFAAHEFRGLALDRGVRVEVGIELAGPTW
jgi:hypothetical protein